ncbi:unnamed protein product [Scytosiphon promiscuus]
MVRAVTGAVARALAASSLILARSATFCSGFVAPGLGSTALLSTPVISNINRLGTTAGAAVSEVNKAERCRGSAVFIGVGSDSGATCRRRGPSRRWRSSATALKMMAGECVGGTDVSRVLFVCLYNIITSPCAEGCLNKKILDEFGVMEEGEETWEVDSCGTGGGSPDWYKKGGVSLFEGQEPDERVEIAAAQRKITTRGLNLKAGGGSRPLTPDDLDKFDVILGIDDNNVEAIMAAAEHWGKADAAAKKTRSLLSYCTEHQDVETIPNPYYAGRDGFEFVVDVIQDAVDNLFAKSLRGEALSYD